MIEEDEIRGWEMGEKNRARDSAVRTFNGHAVSLFQLQHLNSKYRKMPAPTPSEIACRDLILYMQYRFISAYAARPDYRANPTNRPMLNWESGITLEAVRKRLTIQYRI